MSITRIMDAVTMGVSIDKKKKLGNNKVHDESVSAVQGAMFEMLQGFEDKKSDSDHDNNQPKKQMDIQEQWRIAQEKSFNFKDEIIGTHINYVG